MARPSETANNTIASIRITCDDSGALRNLLTILEGALGKPARISKPYGNSGASTTRYYLEFVVPCATESENI